MKTRKTYLVLAIFALIIYIADQLMKWWVVTHMSEGQTIDVLGSVVRWYYIRNSGAAFSIGENLTLLFSIVMVIAAVGILIFARKVRSALWALALGLILGGALGNLTDRLFRAPGGGFGHVVDYVALPHFAIFNFADAGVSIGVVLILVLTLRGISYDGKSGARAAQRAAAPNEESERGN